MDYKVKINQGSTYSLKGSAKRETPNKKAVSDVSKVICKVEIVDREILDRSKTKNICSLKCGWAEGQNNENNSTKCECKCRVF